MNSNDLSKMAHQQLFQDMPSTIMEESINPDITDEFNENTTTKIRDDYRDLYSVIFLLYLLITGITILAMKFTYKLVWLSNQTCKRLSRKTTIDY